MPKSPSYPPGAPGQLKVPPANKLNAAGAPAANVMDTIGKVMFPPSNSCQSQSNPTVVSASNAATIAAMGTPMFVPAPCLPIFAGPWAPGSPTCTLGGQPMLNNTSKLPCTMGGVIEIISTPATTVNIP
jgi:hypothetical protein